MPTIGLSFRRSGAALNNWISLMGFLIVQEFSWRFRTLRAGAILAMLEPIIWIAAIVFIRGYLRRMEPHFGTSVTLFISSGILPYYVFVRLSVRSRIVRYDASHRLPLVTSTETWLASVVSEASLILAALVIWFSILWMFGVRGAIPVKPEECLVALLLFAMLGVGMGLINAAIIRRFPMWQMIYAVPSRALVLLSGAYYVVDLMPLRIRDVIVWNPLAHAIELYRIGQYGDQYPHITLNLFYCVTFAIVLLLIGVACHRVTIRSERVR